MRRALWAAVLACSSLVGGLVLAAVWPAQVRTRLYAADLAVSLDPGATDRVHVPTLLGGVDLHFSGVAPGLVAHPQVQPAITEVLRRPGVRLQDLQPGPLEMSAAVRDAAVGLAGHAALGGLLGVLTTLGLVCLAQRSRPRLAQLLDLSVVWVAVTALLLGSLAWTYRTDRFAAYRASGVLGTIDTSRSALSDLQTRANQTAPYLMNVLALSHSLRQQFQPAEQQPVVTRVLLVSDIHGANQYALLKRVVETEEVQAVIDAGDIVNLGTTTELDRAGIPAGIASLKVPYLFVRGNHDATSPTDEAVLRRLARVPNVRLLEPTAGRYAQVDLGGLTVVGFNDPRWFGDSNTDTQDAQRPAAERFAAALEHAGGPAGDREPDIVVGHEPAAVDGLPGRVLINGHMHVPDLQGRRIQAGTTTGGGLLGHFVAGGEKGAELTGQPSSFDLLEFSAECNLVQLTRYQYRDVVEGRPSFDHVMVVNGTQVTPQVSGRTCTAAGAATTSPLQAGSPG